MMEKEALKKLKELTRDYQNLKGNELKNLLQSITTPTGQEKSGKLLRRIEPDGILGKVAIVGNHITQGLDNFIVFEAVRRNLAVQTLSAGFNQWTFLMLQPESELDQFEPDMTICSLDESIIYQHMGDKEWSKQALSLAIKMALEEITQVLTAYSKRTKKMIVLHTIPLPILDWKVFTSYEEKQQVSILWRQFNQDLLNLHNVLENVIVLDFEVLTQEVKEIRDQRMRHYASISFTIDVWQAFSKELVSILASIKGLSKKVIALDLDNTLWGGVVGDDGIQGIQISKEFPGNQFYAFQRILQRLQEQGILLAISSKNDWVNVKEVLNSHDDMILVEEDFVQISCNWNPKSDSLHGMSARLNLGEDSFVFVDDNPFERELVSSRLTDVTVIPLSTDPSMYIHNLLIDGYFNTLKSTNEDRTRSKKYKQIAKREEFREASANIEEYLLHLRMELDLFAVTSIHIPRVSQLSQRTNQFNMSTMRLTENEVSEFLDNECYRMYGFSLKDKFGDNGFVGYVQVKREKDYWLIENFVMSCRVFQRKVETEVLRLIMEDAKSEGIAEVIGKYESSPKNNFVANFYEQHGFEIIEKSEDKTKWVYRFETALKKVEWIQLASSQERVSI